jgi:hypothetical protein
MTLIVAATYRAAGLVARTHGLRRGYWQHVHSAYQLIGRRADQVLYGWDANQLDYSVFREISILDAKGMIGPRAA